MQNKKQDNNPYGDDGGSQIGRPSNPKRAQEKKTDKQADGDPATEKNVSQSSGSDSAGTGSTGSGQEGAEGIHGANRGGSETKPGSEPLKHRSDEHVSGYGGDKGSPKRSSDQR